MATEKRERNPAGGRDVSRRNLLKSGVALTASLPLLGREWASAQASGPTSGPTSAPPADPRPILTRTIPATGESVPAVGLGTFLTFDSLPGSDRAPLGEVVRRFWEAGGRFIDTSPLYGLGELAVGDYANTLGITREMFISNKIWSTGEYLADESHALRSLELSQQRLWREQLDLMQCHSLVNVDIVVPYLQAWKREGLIRYVGISHHENLYQPILASWIARGGIDFVQTNYSIFNRQAERDVFPAAQANGTAILINMAFEKSRLFSVVGNRPLPDFASEIGAENWAQFFLKWVLGHPAVTCVLTATSNPEHATENVGALRGPLPDRLLRERMVRHMETIPGFQEIADMPWYPDKDEQYQGVIRRAQAALNERLA